MGIALYLRASYSTPLSLMERNNYNSINLCEHVEFVCHHTFVPLLSSFFLPLLAVRRCVFGVILV